MLVRERRRPRQFAEALPSEGSEEHLERQDDGDPLARGGGLSAIHVDT